MTEYKDKQIKTKTKKTDNGKMSMDTIPKLGLTQVLANVGHNVLF
jgi:hypothetical protein